MNNVASYRLGGFSSSAKLKVPDQIESTDEQSATNKGAEAEDSLVALKERARSGAGSGRFFTVPTIKEPELNGGDEKK